MLVVLYAACNAGKAQVAGVVASARPYPMCGTEKVRARSGNARNGEQGVEEQDSLLTLAMSEVRALPLSVSEASPLGCCVRVDEREERCVRYTGWEDGRCKW